MNDLNYIIGIGFSGSDLPRAAVLAFLFAMFAHKDTNLWRTALLALLIDRTIWPIAAMSVSGADMATITASITALFKSAYDGPFTEFAQHPERTPHLPDIAQHEHEGMRRVFGRARRALGEYLRVPGERLPGSPS